MIFFWRRLLCYLNSSLVHHHHRLLHRELREVQIRVYHHEFRYLILPIRQFSLCNMQLLIQLQCNINIILYLASEWLRECLCFTSGSGDINDP